MSLKEDFPLLARSNGIWEGWYRYIDVDGNQIDAHRSRLICRVTDDDSKIYHQTNYYTWEDGRTDIRDFKGESKDGRLVFDNDLIKGWAAEEPLDESNRTMMLHWTRCGEPDLYLYEMIQLSDCGQYRTRIWQWLKAGRTVQRTLIDEHKVSDDWQGY